MAMTWRQLINAALTTAGSAQIPAAQATITDPYMLQVAEFSNQVYEDVWSACQWRALWTVYNIAYAQNVVTQQIVDAVTAASPNSNCSVVRMMNPQAGRPVALCFDTTSVGVPFPLTESPIADLIYMNTITAVMAVAYSTNFAVVDQGNDIVNLMVYPASATARTIQITLYNPPVRWDPATSDLDTAILIPYKPILMATIWRIFEERGEELGANSQYTEAGYREALDDAVSRDTGDAGGLVLLVD